MKLVAQRINAKNLLLLAAAALLLVACGGGGGGGEGGGGDSERVLWQHNVGADTFAYYSSPALSADQQTVYIGTSINVREVPRHADSLQAVNRDGTLQWQFDLTDGEEVRSTPVVYNNKIYFLADYRTGEFAKEYTDLFCLNEAGQQVWRKRLVGEAGVSMHMNSTGLATVVIQNGNVVAVVNGLYILDAESGAELFTSIDGIDYLNPIKLNSEEIGYVSDQKLYKVNTINFNVVEIDLTAHMPIWSHVMSTPALDSANNLYFGTEAGEVISIDLDGNLNWRYVLGNLDSYLPPFFRSSPAIDEENGLLYIGTKADGDSKMLGLDLSTGELAWEYATGGDVYCSPAIGNDGKLYFSSESNYLYALDSDGVLAWRVGLGRNVTWSSPAIDDSGVLYIGTMGDGNGKGNGRLFAIQTDSTGLKETGWAKIHGSNLNTGTNLP